MPAVPVGGAFAAAPGGLGVAALGFGGGWTLAPERLSFGIPALRPPASPHGGTGSLRRLRRKRQDGRGIRLHPSRGVRSGEVGKLADRGRDGAKTVAGLHSVSGQDGGT